MLAQLGDLEQAPRHVVAEHRRVDAQLLVEARLVDGGQPGRELVEAAALVVERRGAAVGKPVVEAVVAELGGDVGVAARQVVEVVLGQPAELRAAASPAGATGPPGRFLRSRVLLMRDMTVVRAATHTFGMPCLPRAHPFASTAAEPACGASVRSAAARSLG